MQLSQRQTLEIAAKNSLLTFCYLYRDATPPSGWNPEPLHVFICRKIQDAIENHKQIIITVPPQHGKSMIASVYSTIWYLLKNPNRNVALVSYSADLAESKSMQARKLAKKVIDSNLSAEASSRKNWSLTNALDVSFMARGVGGGITGRTVDYLVLDDLIKNHEEAESKTYRNKIWDYMESTISTRVSSQSAAVAILTRWHLDDYASKLHREWGWPIYNIPAICEIEKGDLLNRKIGEVAAPKLKSKSFIMKQKKKLSSYVFNALYRGAPVGKDSARILRKWFKYYDVDPKEIADRYNTYQTVDTAATDKETSDYFVVLTFAIITKDIDNNLILSVQDYEKARRTFKELTKHIYVLDVFRKKIETTDHQKVLQIQREKWSPIKQYVENKTFGINILQTAKEKGLPLEPLKADASKFIRSEQISVYYELGRVWHPKRADWLEDFEDEISSFPAAAYDDQFDCISYAGIVAAKKKLTE